MGVNHHTNHHTNYDGADRDGADHNDAGRRKAVAPLLEARDLVTHFDTRAGRVRAVDGVSLSLRRGETLGVVGESGSGKTVLSRSIMNVLPRKHVIRSGSVTLEGTDILSYSDQQMRSIWGTKIAAVFQDPMTSLNPLMKVGRQLIEAPIEHRGYSRKEALEHATELLSSVRIPEPERRLGQYPHQLSGGMRQRVAIAIALSADPMILFADEPTTALDVIVQAQILELLTTHQRQRDMAMMFVTHDLGVLAGRADEVVVMYAGHVVEHARTRALFKNTRMPYTQALLRSTPLLENRSHIELPTIPGRPPNALAFPPACRFAPRCPMAQEQCVRELPPLTVAEDGHRYRCWFPLGTPAAEHALEANLRQGHTATGLELKPSMAEAVS
jgi:peptide/nickel transport system ATP-binding protein